MLNYILPPIIIVLATVALIFFLFKKVSNIPEADLLPDHQERQRGKAGVGKFPGVLKHLILKVLEKSIQRMKLFSLKFHNISNEWVRDIRKKRQQVEQEVATKEAPVTPDADEDVEMEDIAKEIPPMIRPTVVHPDPKVVAQPQQSQLEDILIRRIAINPKDIEAYERLGDYYNEQSNLPDALECYKQVLKLSPSHYKAKTKIRSIEKIIG